MGVGPPRARAPRPARSPSYQRRASAVPSGLIDKQTELGHRTRADGDDNPLCSTRDDAFRPHVVPESENRQTERVATRADTTVETAARRFHGYDFWQRHDGVSASVCVCVRA